MYIVKPYDTHKQPIRMVTMLIPKQINDDYGNLYNSETMPPIVYANAKLGDRFLLDNALDLYTDSKDLELPDDTPMMALALVPVAIFAGFCKDGIQFYRSYVINTFDDIQDDLPNVSDIDELELRIVIIPKV